MPSVDIWKPPAEEVAAQAFDTKWGDTLHVEITYPEEFFSASVKDLLQQVLHCAVSPYLDSPSDGVSRSVDFCG